MDIDIDVDLYNIGKIEFVPRYKIYLFSSEITFQCKKSWYLGLILTIDESLVTFKGMNKVKFFMPHKPNKQGFKIYILVDAMNNYVFNFIMEPGNGNKNLIIKG